MNKYVVLATFGLFAVSLTVSTSFAETLRESVDRALASHPGVETALVGQIVAVEDFKEARSGLFPAVSSSLTAGRVFGDNSTSRGLTVDRGATYSWLGEGNAALTQPLFDGMETFHRMDASRVRQDSAALNVLSVKETLALRVTQAHLFVLQAQETLSKVKSYYGVIQNYMDRIQLMLDEGVADESEMAQARNISLMLESTIADYEGQLQAAYAGYKELVGGMPEKDLIQPASIVSLLDSDVEQAVQEALKAHPLIRQGDKDLEASGYDVKAEYSGFYPDLDSEFSYLKRDQKEEIGGEVVDARAVLRMSWEFEVGGAQTARTRKSRARYSEVISQNRETARAIEGEVRRAYAEYETAKKQIDLVKEREVVTKGLFDAYETQFEGARVRLLQLMQAENQMFNAQVETISAEYRYLLSQFSILASMGRLLDSVPSIPEDVLEDLQDAENVSEVKDMNEVSKVSSMSLGGKISKAVK